MVALNSGGARAELERRGIEFTAGAFHTSAERGDITVVKLFVDAGMSADTVLDGQGALHRAAAHGELEMVKLLLGLGASVELRDASGFTVLHWAVLGHSRREMCGGQLAVIRYLIADRGMDMNVRALRAGGGPSLLHVAAACGDLEMVNFLVGLGVAVDAVDGDGFTPRGYAEDRGHIEVVLSTRQ